MNFQRSGVALSFVALFALCPAMALAQQSPPGAPAKRELTEEQRKALVEEWRKIPPRENEYGLLSGPGRTYKMLGLTLLPVAADWIEIAKAAGVPVDRKEIADHIYSQCQIRRVAMATSRQEQYQAAFENSGADDESHAEGEGPSANELAFRTAQAKIVRENADEIQATTLACIRAVREAAERADAAAQLDREALEATAQLFARVNLTSALMAAYPGPNPRVLYLDLEDQLNRFATAEEIARPEVRAELVTFRPLAWASLSALMRACASHHEWRIHAGDDRMSDEAKSRSATMARAACKHWDFQLAWIDKFALALGPRGNQFRLERFAALNPAAGATIKASRALDQLRENPAMAEVRELGELRTAFDAAIKGMMSAHREGWELWFRERSYRPSVRSEFERQMQGIAQALETSIAGAYASLRAGSSAATPEALAAAMVELGSVDATGTWKPKARDEWPGFVWKSETEYGGYIERKPTPTLPKRAVTSDPAPLSPAS